MFKIIFGKFWMRTLHIKLKKLKSPHDRKPQNNLLKLKMSKKILMLNSNFPKNSIVKTKRLEKPFTILVIIVLHKSNINKFAETHLLIYLICNIHQFKKRIPKKEVNIIIIRIFPKQKKGR